MLHGIDLTVGTGERVAVVGESGSGKSTTAAAVIGLLPGTGRVTGGSIRFAGEDVIGADERAVAPPPWPPGGPGARRTRCPTSTR